MSSPEAQMGAFASQKGPSRGAGDSPCGSGLLSSATSVETPSRSAASTTRFGLAMGPARSRPGSPSWCANSLGQLSNSCTKHGDGGQRGDHGPQDAGGGALHGVERICSTAVGVVTMFWGLAGYGKTFAKLNSVRRERKIRVAHCPFWETWVKTANRLLIVALMNPRQNSTVTIRGRRAGRRRACVRRLSRALSPAKRG